MGPLQQQPDTLLLLKELLKILAQYHAIAILDYLKFHTVQVLHVKMMMHAQVLINAVEELIITVTKLKPLPTQSDLLRQISEVGSQIQLENNGMYV